MSFIVRKGKKTDMKQALSLIKELAIFEKEPEAVVVTKKILQKDGFKKKPLFKTFVAEMDGEIAGMALFYPRYSTWKGPSLHLEDLIVKKEKRGLGIGKALYDKVLKYAYKKKVKRVEWVVLDWNTTAIDFYKKSGAKILYDWRTTQMDEEGLRNYIENN
jgi:GNAT superfamily N-acetyltransferase